MPKKSKSKTNTGKKKTELELMPKSKMSASADIAVLEQALGGDKELVLFFLAWLKHNRNATKAYKELHPDCTEKSCGVLGSRMLGKVSIPVILDSYGLGMDTYFEKLKDGLNAVNIELVKVVTEKKDKKGKKKKEIKYEKVETPNYSVQSQYHERLGKILGVEGNNTNVAVQVNTNTNIIDNISDDELEDLIS